MKDIAEGLGVSLMTVSKALRNHGDIAEETRRRVLERAQALNYQPNLTARSLVNRRTYLIGLVIPDLMHSFFAEVAKGAEDKLAPKGYQILISNSGERVETELQQILSLRGRNVDGLIIASAADSAASPVVEALKKYGASYVQVDRAVPGLKGNYVGVDDEEIGYLATSHLVAQGCQRVAHIRGPENGPAKGRLRGYRRALEDHRLTVPTGYISSGGGNADVSGHAAMQRLLHLTPLPDGVFCYNDPVAAGAMKAILEADLNIPKDIAVIGAGNVHYSDLLRVPLSTIDQSSRLIGQTAARLLLDALEAKASVVSQRILFAPRLLMRESSKRQS